MWIAISRHITFIGTLKAVLKYSDAVDKMTLCTWNVYPLHVIWKSENLPSFKDLSISYEAEEGQDSTYLSKFILTLNVLYFLTSSQSSRKCFLYM